MKLGFLVAENAPFIGQLHTLDIGLSKIFEEQTPSSFELIDEELIQCIYKPRPTFAHKGTFGHALLVAGNYGKMGAVVLAAQACLHTGIGLLSCAIPKCGYEIMQSTVPEAMAIKDDEEQFPSILPNEIEKYQAVSVGPGIGTKNETQM